MSGGQGCRQRAERTCPVVGEKPPVHCLGKGEPCLPCSHPHLMPGSDLCSDSPWLKRLPSGDFLPAQRDRRWLPLLCYLPGTHPHRLLSSQAGKRIALGTRAGKGSPGQTLQTRARLGGKGRGELGQGKRCRGNGGFLVNPKRGSELASGIPLGKRG